MAQVKGASVGIGISIGLHTISAASRGKSDIWTRSGCGCSTHMRRRNILNHTLASLREPCRHWNERRDNRKQRCRKKKKKQRLLAAPACMAEFFFVAVRFPELEWINFFSRLIVLPTAVQLKPTSRALKSCSRSMVESGHGEHER